MRLYDWEVRLQRYICTVAREAFAYGKHDCALFAAGGVEALTGEDPAADWRGRYSTELGGLRHLRKAGFTSHIDQARALFPDIPLGGAMPGDLAILPDGGGALGIVQGEVIYVLRPEGIGLVPLEAATAILGVR